MEDSVKSKKNKRKRRRPPPKKVGNNEAGKKMGPPPPPSPAAAAAATAAAAANQEMKLENPKRPFKGSRNNPEAEKYDKYFVGHFDGREIAEGLKKGRLKRGTLRINGRSYLDAFISPPETLHSAAGSKEEEEESRWDIIDLPDYYIHGIKDRNRALNGDDVIYEMNDEKHWKVLDEKIKDFLLLEGSLEDFKILLPNYNFSQKLRDRYSSPSPPPCSQDEKSTLRNRRIMKKKNKKAREISIIETVNNPEPWGQTPLNTQTKWNVSELPSRPIHAPIFSHQGVDIISFGSTPSTSSGPLQLNQTKKSTRRSRRKHKPLDSSPILNQTEKKKPITIMDPETLNKMLPDPSMGLTVTTTCNMSSPLLMSSSSKSSNGGAIMSTTIDSSLTNEMAKIKIDVIDDDPISDKENKSSMDETHYNESEEDDDNEPDVILESVDGVVIDNNKKAKRQRRPKRQKKKNVSSALEANAHKPSKKEFEKIKRSIITNDKNLKFTIDVVKKHPKWEKFVQKTVRVVAIDDFKHSRTAAGTLKLFADKNPNWAFFSPNDSRIPRMKIPMKEAPEGFFKRPEDFKTTLFVAKIKEWKQISYAIGTLTRKLGELNDIKVKTQGMLIENEIDDSDFKQDVLNCLPQLPWNIPEDELAKRRDFRQKLVFTIDPFTARDLDDALSITQLGKNENKFRVGVHIADVGYFVKAGSPLDKIAFERATSVYLVEKVIPMLPRPLCENLCSLNPGEDRLTFTVEWTMDDIGNISDIWFGKSVIRSAVKLAYEHAQSMIDDPKREWKIDELPKIETPWMAKDISEKVNLLQKIAVKLRQRRYASGALKLDQQKISFTLDPETGLPQGYRVYEYKPSNGLIEEFMLLANITVAEKILHKFPKLAILRCHPQPKSIVLDQTVSTLSLFGIHINPDNSKRMQESLNKYKPNPSDTQSFARYQALMSLCSKPMELAQYLCSGNVDNSKKFRHYALSIPFYTHFTSPIRRFPDILVHRLLEAACTNKRLEDTNYWNNSHLGEMAKHCNKRKHDAKKVSEESAECFLALFIRECGPLENVPGIVVEVKDHSLDVLILEMAVIKRVYIDRLIDTKEANFKKDKGIMEMNIKWNNDKSLKLTCFSLVNLTLTNNPDKSYDYIAIIECPN